MTAAALTPRVRSVIICDDAIPSDTEDGVYHLDGVRIKLSPGAFPCTRDVNLFLLLSCPHRGSYSGWVQVEHHQSNKTIRHEHFLARFLEDNELVSLSVPIENCLFRMAGEYAFEVWFSAKDGQAAQKGELSLLILEGED